MVRVSFVSSLVGPFEVIIVADGLGLAPPGEGAGERAGGD